MSSKEYVAGPVTTTGEGRVCRIWRVKGNLLTWLPASGWSGGSVGGGVADHLHERACWSPEAVICVPRDWRSLKG